MVTKRDLVIAVLCTFFLTFTLFTILPAGSQTVGQYDPWLDINDNGHIDGTDIAYVARAFGTAGDTTKNVSVVNWPSIEDTNVTNWPSIYNSNITNWPLDSNVTATNLPLDEQGNLKVKEQTTVQTYKDAIEVTVFDSPTRLYDGREYASPSYIFDFCFGFSPKQKFINVTGFSVNVMGNIEGGVTGFNWWPFNVTMNNQLIYSDAIQTLCTYIGTRTNLVTDPAKCLLIQPGINRIMVDFRSLGFIFSLSRVQVLIEYEYQA